MKILAIVTGIGYGDATRDYAILKSILKKQPDSEIVVVAYENSFNFFKNKFRTIKMRGYKLPGFNLKFQLGSFLALNIFLPFLWILDAFKIKRQLRNFKPDIILSDLEPTSILLSKLLRKRCIIVFAYDPKKLEDYEKSHKLSFKQKLQKFYLNMLYSNKTVKKVIIPTILGKKDNHGKYQYIDPILRKIPSKLPSKEHLMKKLKLNKHPILVMIGGSNFGLTLANKLFKHVTQFEEDFIFFGYNSNFSRDNIKAYEFKENFLEYLKVSKGVITLAGYSTLSEAIFYKIPALVFPIENHIEQALNTYSIKDYFNIGDQEDIGNSIKKFIEDLPVLSKKLEKVHIKHSGNLEAADIILNNP